MATPIITHTFVSSKSAASDSSRVDGPKWNDTHVVTGLENVDNTSDANKPVSTAQAAADAVVAANAANASNLTSGTIPQARLRTAIDIFLVIGDSNAVGQGTSASAPTVPSGQAVVYTAAGTIVDANDPAKSAISSGQDASTGSMWPAFGIAYGRKVGLVLTGKSGTTQASAADTGSGNWDTGGSLYAASITALNAALTAFATAGYTTTFRGIIYILGSNDAAQINASVITSGQYTTALTTMITNYRAATIGGTTYPQMQVFLPLIGTNISASDTGYAQIRSAQLAYAATDGNTLVPFVDFLSFNSRGLMNSGAHPTQAGYNLMGTQIGSSMVPHIPANIPYRLFNASTGLGPEPSAGTVLHVVGADATSSFVGFDNYGASFTMLLRQGSGTAVAPTNTTSGTTLGIFAAKGRGATAFQSANNGALLFSATQDHTDTAHGTSTSLYVTANGSTTPSRALLLNQDRTAQFPAYGLGLLQSDASGNVTSSNTVAAGTLGSGVQALTLTATQPASPAGTQSAYVITVTGAGSASQTNIAVQITYAAGYTGSSSTFGYVCNNNSAGTANTPVPAAGSNGAAGNTGASGGANVTTTGTNMGIRGSASGGVVNVALHGLAQIATNGATNIGAMGSAINTGTTPVSIGGFFHLNQTTIPTVSAGLIADNGSQSLPVALFRVNGTTKFQVDSSGNLLGVGATTGVGYGTGAGGTITQATNKATGVTLSTASGAITMNNAALAAGTIVSFVLTNTAIAATDVLILNHISGGTPGSYSLNARAAAGSATIDVRNNTGGSLSEAIVIQFALIKAVNS